jgi:hypothetical protein
MIMKLTGPKMGRLHSRLSLTFATQPVSRDYVRRPLSRRPGPSRMWRRWRTQLDAVYQSLSANPNPKGEA